MDLADTEGWTRGGGQFKAVEGGYLCCRADTHLPLCSGCPWKVAECGSAGLRRGGAWRGGAWWWLPSAWKLDCCTAPRVLRLDGTAPPAAV